MTDDLHQAEREVKDADQRSTEAQALIDEAEEIAATPEVTTALKASIQDKRAALASQQRQVESLSSAERSLRKRTKKQRIVFVAVLAVIVCVVVLIALFAFGVLGH